MAGKKGALQVIADVMQQSAGETGWAHYKLGGGLQLVLVRKERHCSLRMARLASSGKWPGVDEVAIVRKAFLAPEDASEVAEVREKMDKKTGCTVGYNVVEVSWMEVGQ